VRLLNAGHLPPVVVRRNELEELPRGAPALGIMTDTDYDEHQVELEQGELLVVYSDGLTEARDEQGRFYGSQTLFELLPELYGQSARDAGERLLRTNESFVGREQASDDLSLVVLRRTGP
jgi:sigma-B regulation protein RsbU (phosphoserine phosphatase)